MPTTRWLTLEEMHDRLAVDPAYREVHNELLLAGVLSHALVGYRAEHGLTQAALGERLGMTQPQISRIEAGDHTPDYRTLLRICDALGLEIDIRIGPKADRTPPAPHAGKGAVADASTQAVISIRPA